jgi:hypothetical protein
MEKTISPSTCEEWIGHCWVDNDWGRVERQNRYDGLTELEMIPIEHTCKHCYQTEQRLITPAIPPMVGEWLRA